VPTQLLGRFHSPAGLAIGAEGPEEIALSIMAEIVSIRRRAAAGRHTTAHRKG